MGILIRRPKAKRGQAIVLMALLLMFVRSCSGAGAELMGILCRRSKAKRGQAIVLMALMLMFVLAGGVGLGVDALVGYVQSLGAERAAAAAALAGVVYMPNQFNSPPVNNASEKAIAISKQNGF